MIQYTDGRRTVKHVAEANGGNTDDGPTGPDQMDGRN
jgi:hypothetical protein